MFKRWQPRQTKTLQKTQDTTRKLKKLVIKYTGNAQEMHKERQETQVVAREKAR